MVAISDLFHQVGTSGDREAVVLMVGLVLVVLVVVLLLLLLVK